MATFSTPVMALAERTVVPSASLGKAVLAMGRSFLCFGDFHHFGRNADGVGDIVDDHGSTVDERGIPGPQEIVDGASVTQVAGGKNRSTGMKNT